jgi:hypothetical protein
MVASFEPTTNVVALSYHQPPYLMRYDPAQHTLEPLALGSNLDLESTTVIPLAPELAGGAHLIAMTAGSLPMVTWYADDTGNQPIASLRTMMTYAGGDRAGDVFLHDAGGSSLVVYRSGKRIGELPWEHDASPSADATSTRVAQAGPHGVAVYELTGKPVWRRTLDATGTPLWLDDGSIAVRSSTGVVRLDARTGAVIAARCGWRFGRSVSRHDQPARGRSVCELLQRS